MDRLGMLQNMVTAKPDEAFPRYGLAMELKKHGRSEEAAAQFAELSSRNPGYVPCYLMHGNLLEAMGRAQEAAAVYAKGIEVADAAGDEHAMSELRAARDALT